MKIIENKGVPNWKHVFTCARCESKLEASHEDLRARYHECNDPREPAPSYWTYDLCCQVCGYAADVAEDLIPKYLKYLAQERSKISAPFGGR